MPRSYGKYSEKCHETTIQIRQQWSKSATEMLVGIFIYIGLAISPYSDVQKFMFVHISLGTPKLISHDDKG